MFYLVPHDQYWDKRIPHLRQQSEHFLLNFIFLTLLIKEVVLQRKNYQHMCKNIC